MKSKATVKFILLSLILLAAVPISSCTAQQKAVLAETASIPAEQTAILEAQAVRAKKVELTVYARVLKLLRDDTRGLPHQRFLIILANNSTVLVANDTRYGERVPVKPGDWVRIKGEYIWNEKGGVLHWTHRSDNPRHPGGWIELNGKLYQ